MTAVADAPATEIAAFRHQATLIRQVLRLNTDGITHEESLIQPVPAGNCLNFVVGHLLWVYNNVARMLGQEPVMPGGELDRYARGSRPLTDPAEAIDFATLLSAWETACDRVEEGLGTLTSGFLDLPAQNSPTNNPNETNRTLLGTVFFHQAYHTGQAGILRRIAGKAGAIT
ncbi:MAG TPA: DUF664 domain-containing protein [Longimicrobiaceae bacterium]